MKSPGQVAYEAAAACANPFWLDEGMAWEMLPEPSREYWSKVAAAVLAQNAPQSPQEAQG